MKGMTKREKRGVRDRNREERRRKKREIHIPVNLAARDHWDCSFPSQASSLPSLLRPFLHPPFLPTTSGPSPSSRGPDTHCEASDDDAPSFVIYELKKYEKNI